MNLKENLAYKKGINFLEELEIARNILRYLYIVVYLLVCYQLYNWRKELKKAKYNGLTDSITSLQVSLFLVFFIHVFLIIVRSFSLFREQAGIPALVLLILWFLGASLFGVYLLDRMSNVVFNIRKLLMKKDE